MNKPFFSIISCVYNSEKFLDRNFTSVKIQSFRDYEHIIVYSPSSDKSKEIIQKYIKENKNVRLTKMNPKGISPAFNRGILVSRGKYLMFLNSDDSFYDGDVLKDVHKILIDGKNPDWVYGKISVIEADGREIGVFPNRKIFQTPNKHLLKIMNYIPHQSVFIKNEVFERKGIFDEQLTSEMDYEYWLRIAGSTRWKFINRIIADYAIGKTAQSSSIKNVEINNRNLDKVQKKYLNPIELIIAKMVNILISKFSKIIR